MKIDLFGTLNNQLSAINSLARQSRQAKEAQPSTTFAMQTFFGSVKNLNASSPTSRPTPF
jgi:hypothetical protein